MLMQKYVVKEPEVVPMPTPVQPAPIIKEVKEEPTPEAVEPVKVEEEAPVKPIVEEVKATEPEPVVEEAAPVEPEVVRTASEPIVEEVEAPVVEEAPIEKEPVVVEEPKAGELVVEEVTVEKPTPVETTPEVETPVVEETVEPEPVVEEAKVAPVVEETAPVEPEVVRTASEPVVEEPTPVETAPTVETPAVEEVVEPVKVEEVTPVEPIVEEVEAPVVEETLVEKEPEPVVEEVKVAPVVEEEPAPVVGPAPAIAREIVQETPVYRYTVREEQESVPAEPIPVEMPSVKKESPTEQLVNDDVVDLGSVSLGSVFVEEKKDDVLSRCVKTKVIRESRAFTSYEAELDGKDVVVTIYGFEPSQAAMSDMLYDRFEKLGNIHSPMFTAYPCVERNGDELVVIAEKEPDGMPLEKLAGKLSNERALHYMQQVAEGMKVLHEHGLPVDVVSPSFFKVTMTGNIHFIAGRIRTMKDAPVLEADQKFVMPGFVEDEVRASLYAIGAMTYYLLNGTLYSEEGVREHIANDPANSAVYRMIYFCCTDIEQIRIKDYESLVNEITNNR